MSEMYGTLNEANTYFNDRLHADLWFEESSLDRTRALYMATRLMDRLNYKGCKHTVHELTDPTAAEKRVAELAQELEFPRDSDTEVPADIKIACYEIAFALIDGVDPDLELENLGVVSQGYAGVRTTYNRDQQPIEHLINGVPSATAWRIIRPYLRDARAIKFKRV